MTALEKDDNGIRWVHLDTTIGSARLCLPEAGVIVQGGQLANIREGDRIRTTSDAVSGMSRKPYYRVREVTILAAKSFSTRAFPVNKAQKICKVF